MVSIPKTTVRLSKEEAAYHAALEVPDEVEAEVLLDTSAIILLFYAGADEEKLAKKVFFRRITNSYKCCISPITVGELMTDKWFRSLGENRTNEQITKLKRFEMVAMNYATGHHQAKMKWSTQKPGPNDQWQVTLASLHELYLATADDKMYGQCRELAKIWTPTKPMEFYPSAS